MADVTLKTRFRRLRALRGVPHLRAVLVERMHIRPFTLETEEQDLQVDASHVDNARVSRREGHVQLGATPQHGADDRHTLTVGNAGWSAASHTRS